MSRLCKEDTAKWKDPQSSKLSMSVNVDVDVDVRSVQTFVTGFLSMLIVGYVDWVEVYSNSRIRPWRATSGRENMAARWE